MSGLFQVWHLLLEAAAVNPQHAVKGALTGNETDHHWAGKKIIRERKS